MMRFFFLFILGCLGQRLVPMLDAQLSAQSPPPLLKEVPSPWKVTTYTQVDPNQLQSIAKKLNAPLVDLNNVLLSRGDDPLQINRMELKNSDEAAKLYRVLTKGKSSRLVILRDRWIYELVVRNATSMRAALLSRYELHLLPDSQTYDVEFDAIPLIQSNDMEWNRLFNHFLALDRGDSSAATKIAALQSSFKPSRELRLRTFGVGKSPTRWRVDGASPSKEDPRSDESTFPAGKKEKAGFSVNHVVGTLKCTYKEPSPPSGEKAERWLVATSAWPIDAPELQAAIQPWREQPFSQKLKSLVAWIQSNQVMRFDGEVVGSRYGTLKALSQGYGHCWDYSDVFISAARASGIPARQVFGWLSTGEGHVWCEVLTEDGWVQFDPTSGIACGSDYLPFANSDDGHVPLVYASSVMIRPQ